MRKSFGGWGSWRSDSDEKKRNDWDDWRKDKMSSSKLTSLDLLPKSFDKRSVERGYLSLLLNEIMREWSIFKNLHENYLESKEWAMISDRLRNKERDTTIFPYLTLMTDLWNQNQETKIKTTECVFALLWNIHLWNVGSVEDSNNIISQHLECTSMKMQS